MSQDPDFSRFYGHCLTGEEIRVITSLGPRPNTAFVLLGSCCIQLRPVYTLVSDIRLRRDQITDESYLPYLGQIRGPRHIYDPETSEELPRIRLYVPENMSFELQREFFSCFSKHSLVLYVKGKKGPIPNAKVQVNAVLGPLILGGTETTTADQNGRVILLGMLEGTYSVTVSASGYETLVQDITVPPYVHTIKLREAIVAQYFTVLVIVSMDYTGEAQFEISIVVATKDGITSEAIKATAQDLAYTIMSDYLQTSVHPKNDNFLNSSTLRAGEVRQVSDKKMSSLVTPTQAQVIDMRYNKIRATYNIDWYEQFTLNGKSVINYSGVFRQ